MQVPHYSFAVPPSHQLNGIVVIFSRYDAMAPPAQREKEENCKRKTLGTARKQLA